MTYHYHTFGLNIQSEIALPELLTTAATVISDVQIKIGKTPTTLPNCLKRGVTYEVAEQQFLLDLKDIARFYVSNGDSIIIEPKAGSVEGDIRLFLLGSCLGAILHQRKTLALHASAIVHDGKAVLFTGISGAGKSTTANAFRLCGHKILTDDICPIQFIDGKPYALSGYPQSKLWEDSLEQMKIQYDHLQHIRSGIHKRRIPIIDAFVKEPTEIKALYILNTHNKDVVESFEVDNANKFRLIKNMTYRRYLLKDMGVQSCHFMNVSQLATYIHIKRIVRPRKFSITEVVNTITSDLKNLSTLVHEY